MQINGRIWLMHRHKPLLGKGRVEMLRMIGKTGSISAAGIQLGLAYRKAWRLVDSMNRESPVPLVIRQTGGKGGGGSRLTKAGAEAIELYEMIEEDFERFLDHETGKANKSFEQWKS